MQRYFGVEKLNDQLVLNSDDLHHIKRVMRYLPGQELEVVYQNVLYLTTLTDNDQAKIISIIDQGSNIYQVDIAPALIKEKNWNYLLQKSTELGVRNIIPIYTTNTVVKIENNKHDNKIERWTKIVKEASEQTKRLDIPCIFDIIDMKLLKYADYDLCLFGHPNEDQTIRKILHKVTDSTKILFISGPEGGFTDSEVAYLISKGCKGIKMGSNVLRAETAPIVFLSMFQYELME